MQYNAQRYTVSPPLATQMEVLCYGGLDGERIGSSQPRETEWYWHLGSPDSGKFHP